MMTLKNGMATLPVAWFCLFAILPLLLLMASCGSDNPASSNQTPAELAQAEWQVDLTYLGGDFRVGARLVQSGSNLSGDYNYSSGGTNFDVSTSGAITGSAIDVTITLEKNTAQEASFRCVGTIGGGSPQTISGTFTSTTGSGTICGGVTPCSGDFHMQ